MATSLGLNTQVNLPFQTITITNPNCIISNGGKPLIINYGLENLVAEFPFIIKDFSKVNGEVITLDIEYIVRAYNSKSKQKKGPKLQNGQQLTNFLYRHDFDIVAFYESYEPKKIFDSPFLVIYSHDNKAYIIVDSITYMCMKWEPISIYHTVKEFIEEQIDNQKELLRQSHKIKTR